jgi:3-keto-5-aminohexanoate cleavage enzyme
VGLEDNVWFDEARTDPASNPRLVERLVTIARAMGREPATPAQIRERLGIPQRP